MSRHFWRSSALRAMITSCSRSEFSDICQNQKRLGQLERELNQDEQFRDMINARAGNGFDGSSGPYNTSCILFLSSFQILSQGPAFIVRQCIGSLVNIMLILFDICRYMVEPLACGVFNTVLPRHVAFVQSSTSSLKRVVNGTRRPSLAANFFIPTLRSDKGKEKARDLPSVDEVLGCQSWATPTSKKEVWDQGV